MKNPGGADVGARWGAAPGAHLTRRPTARLTGRFPRSRRRTPWRAAGMVVLVGALAAGATPAAGATASGAGGSGPASVAPGMLGLPALSLAQSYVEAPSSRIVVPQSVREFTAANDDFVTAGSLSPSVTVAGASPVNSGPSQSEAAHEFAASPHSTRARLMGVAVQEAGPSIPRAWFSYRLHVPASGPVRIRVEDVASATADYWVLIDGIEVYHRAPQQSQAGLVSESGPQFKGLLHYSFQIPSQALAAAPRSGNGRVLRIEFRNTLSPGPGARIARVWAISPAVPGARPAAPYGGTVGNPQGAWGAGGMVMSSATYGRPFAIFGFGKDIGGQVSFHVSAVSRPVTVGLAFSESSEYMTSASDFSGGSSGVWTETHYLTIKPGQTSVIDPVIRGGFRYLMVFLDTPGSLRISRLHVDYTPDPGVTSLRNYPGAFLSSAALLNRLWYAGAYTVQMDTINPATGRPYPATPGPSANNATIASGSTAIVDGAKRDRLDWAGDQSVEDPVAYLSAGQALAARNSFEWLASHPFPNGELPGVYLPCCSFQSGWGTYALFDVANYYDYYLYTGSHAFLTKWWPAIKGDLAWAHSLVGTDNLIHLPGQYGGSWGYGASGRIAFMNALYVWVLRMAVRAATVQGDTSLAASYTAQAAVTSSAINSTSWNASAGAYQVSPSDSAIPQDANAMAVVAGVASGARAQQALTYLRTHMATRYGTETINVAGNVVAQYVSPFITYYQLLGELDLNTAAATDAAVGALERTWGYMLNSPVGTASTFWEGISLNGYPEMGSYTSLSHGWAAGVVPLLTNQVLGVVPTGGGLSTFSVLPHPAGSLHWAEGRVPTPQGPVIAAWRSGPAGQSTAGHFQLQVEAPAGTTFTAGVPAAAGASVWAKGRLVWSNGHAAASGVVEQDGYIEMTGQQGAVTLSERW